MKGLSISKEAFSNLSLISKNLFNSKPLCLIGGFMTGKSTFIKLVAKDLLKKRIIHFSPSLFSSNRDLYGIYDPFSTT